MSARLAGAAATAHAARRVAPYAPRPSSVEPSNVQTEYLLKVLIRTPQFYFGGPVLGCGDTDFGIEMVKY